jgi:hypothetical protein
MIEALPYERVNLQVVSAIVVLLGCSNAAANARDQTGIPAAAAAAGYFVHTQLAPTPSSVDINDTTAPGYLWYRRSFFQNTSTPREGITFNQSNTLILQNGVLLSGAPTKQSHWTGLAFGGGGYFEAELKFDPDQVIRRRETGWPAFWTMAVEHFAGLKGQQWLGQKPGFAHFIEVDAFEYDLATLTQKNRYGATIHDWFGTYTCAGQGYCNVNTTSAGGSLFANAVITLRPSVDLSQYHRYGFLWIPATQTAKGYVQNFFDGRPVGGRTTWDKFENELPPPGKTKWSFGILDQQHLLIALQSGASQPMSVQSVDIWQKSTKDNLINR